MSKILAVGDSVRLPTGYGRVSMNVLGYFALKGHEVSQIAWGHSEPPYRVQITDSTQQMQAGIMILPVFTGDQFGAQSVAQYAQQWKPDLIYNSNDFFTSTEMVKNKNGFKYCNYGIIDGPGCAKCYQEIIKGIDIPVTPSMYGYQQLKEVTDQGLYIPHGVNTQLYKPSQYSKEILKDKYGLAGKFVYGCANRNIWRKQYPNILRAFANLKHVHGIKDIAMFIISDPYDPAGNNFVNWAAFLGLTISNDPAKPADIMLHPRNSNILFCLSDEQLAEAYNTFDVMVSASMSEGFGLCTIEAQACGTPVIICDNTANTELVKGHGWLYPTAKGADGNPILIPPTIRDITYWYEQPDYSAMEMCMRDAYHSSALVNKYSKDALAFARGYDWGTVLPKWDQVLARCQPQ